MRPLPALRKKSNHSSQRCSAPGLRGCALVKGLSRRRNRCWLLLRLLVQLLLLSRKAGETRTTGKRKLVARAVLARRLRVTALARVFNRLWTWVHRNRFLSLFRDTGRSAGSSRNVNGTMLRCASANTIVPVATPKESRTIPVIAISRRSTDALVFLFLMVHSQRTTVRLPSVSIPTQ